MNFLYDPFWVYLVRILTGLAALAGLYWSVKSAYIRSKLEIMEFSDGMLVFVMLYWSFYSVALVLVYNGHRFPDDSFYQFNMRFGGFLTLAAIVSLIKDRLLLSALYQDIRSVVQYDGDDPNGVEP